MTGVPVNRAASIQHHGARRHLPELGNEKIEPGTDDREDCGSVTTFNGSARHNRLQRRGISLQAVIEPLTPAA